jgi:hypothetical protein
MLQEAVQYCTERTPSVASVALWILYSSVQPCTNRSGFADVGIADDTTGGTVVRGGTEGICAI